MNAKLLICSLFLFPLFATLAPLTASAASLSETLQTKATEKITNFFNTQTGVTNTTQTQTGVTNTGQTVRLLNPLNSGDCSSNQNCLMQFLQKILEFVVRIGTVIVVLMMVYVGYLFIKAQGKPEEIKEARNALLWTVIGALILLGAQAIAYGIQATVQAISVGQ